MHHACQFPRQIHCVLEACVGTAHAENRQQMGGIACKNNAAMHIVGQGQGASGIHCAPVHFPFQIAKTDHVQLVLHGFAQVFRFQRFFWGDIGRQLVIKTPNVIGLTVHQNGVAWIPIG